MVPVILFAAFAAIGAAEPTHSMAFWHQITRNQNMKNLLAKLAVLLDAGSQPSDAVQSAHESVRAALTDAF